MTRRTRLLSVPAWEDEFVAFVATSSAQLHRTAYLLTAGDSHLAEDLVQTALIGTYRSWPRLRDKAAALAFTRVAVVNAHHDHFRRSWNRESTDLDAERDDIGVETSTNVDTRVDMLRVLRRLPPRQRAVIVCRFYEDMSEQQIADALGCSPGTVKKTSHNALRRLRVMTEAAPHEAPEPEGRNLLCL